eukprot:gene7276-1271_t
MLPPHPAAGATVLSTSGVAGPPAATTGGVAVSPAAKKEAQMGGTDEARALLSHKARDVV